MSFLDAMQWRYATKVYDAKHDVSLTDLEELKQILRLSPSSINSQPWHFTFVTDPTAKNKLSEYSYFNKQKIEECTALVVFSCTDNIPLFEQWLQNTQPQGVVEYYNTMIKPLGDEKIKEWFGKQVYLAVGTLLSACAVMKIDSTPMEGIDTVKYDEYLKQSDYKTLVAVAIGYRNSDDYNQPSLHPKSRRNPKDIITSL